MKKITYYEKKSPIMQKKDHLWKKITIYEEKFQLWKKSSNYAKKVPIMQKKFNIYAKKVSPEISGLSRSNRKYLEEQKRMAVKLAEYMSLAEIWRRLGIPESSLREWRKNGVTEDKRKKNYGKKSLIPRYRREDLSIL